jgi:hypothetical protein
VLVCALGHDEGRRQHHLLYLDGEEEWADLSRENVVWLRATRHGALSAGIVTGAWSGMVWQHIFVAGCGRARCL